MGVPAGIRYPAVVMRCVVLVADNCGNGWGLQFRSSCSPLSSYPMPYHLSEALEVVMHDLPEPSCCPCLCLKTGAAVLNLLFGTWLRHYSSCHFS